MPFDEASEEGMGEAGTAGARRAARLAWLASVRAALVEATALVDAIAAEGVDTAEAGARLRPACDAIEALRAALGGSAPPRSDTDRAGG